MWFTSYSPSTSAISSTSPTVHGTIAPYQCLGQNRVLYSNLFTSDSDFGSDSHSNSASNYGSILTACCGPSVV